MADFFISYTRADRSWAEWIDWQLRAAEYSTVVQAFDFRPGSNFVVEMDRAAREAERTIAVLSPDFLRSEFTAPEWAAAFASDSKGRKGRLVPVRVRECEPGGLLGQIVRVDLVGAGDGEEARLLRRGGSEDYPDTVATTWEISFRRLAEDAPAAAALLELCAFLAPDDVPRHLLSDAAARLPEPLATAAADPVAWLDTVAAARRFSLLEADEASLSVHRLVQAVTRDRLGAAGREKWSAAAADLVDGAFGYQQDDLATWPTATRLLPHAVAALGHLEGEPSTTVARLWNETGLYLHDRGELEPALRHLQAALAIDEAVFGDRHPNVAKDANNIGQILRAQGDLDGARSWLERALSIFEETYGPDNPSTVTVRKNLESL